jgi:hypothetical protein
VTARAGRAALALALAAAAGACGGGGPDPADPDAAPEEVDGGPVDALTISDAVFEQDPDLVDLYCRCPLDQRLGGFKVEANQAQGYSFLDGVVLGGIVPGRVPEIAAEGGGCALLRPRRLVCDPPCQPGSTCGFDEECVPMPVGEDMGTLFVRGLVDTFAVTPLQPGNIYSYTRLDHPAFEPGRVVQLASSPGFLGELELYGVGVEEIAPDSETLVLTEGQPLAVTWTAPVAHSRSTLHIEVTIDVHGATPLLLTCDLPDTGAGEVPQTIVDAFIASGVTGFPSGMIARRTADSVSEGGQCVDFLIASTRPIAIEVTGHTPCTNDLQCEPPQTCNEEIEQCE